MNPVVHSSLKELFSACNSSYQAPKTEPDSLYPITNEIDHRLVQERLSSLPTQGNVMIGTSGIQSLELWMARKEEDVPYFLLFDISLLQRNFWNFIIDQLRSLNSPEELCKKLDIHIHKQVAIAKVDQLASSSYLRSPNNVFYRHWKRLQKAVDEGRVVILNFDVSRTSQWMTLLEKLTRQQLFLDTIYLSNISHYYRRYSSGGYGDSSLLQHIICLLTQRGQTPHVVYAEYQYSISTKIQYLAATILEGNPSPLRKDFLLQQTKNPDFHITLYKVLKRNIPYDSSSLSISFPLRRESFVADSRVYFGMRFVINKNCLETLLRSILVAISYDTIVELSESQRQQILAYAPETTLFRLLDSFNQKLKISLPLSPDSTYIIPIADELLRIFERYCATPKSLQLLRI